MGGLFPPITIHLWFLYYLFLYCLISFMLLQLGRQLLPESIRNLPTKIIGTIMTIPGGSILLCIPLAYALNKSAGLLITGLAFIPETTSFFSYGFIYLCGWAFWSQRSLLEKLRSWPKTIFALVMTLVLYPIWMDFFLQWVGLPPGQERSMRCMPLSCRVPYRDGK